MLRSIWAGRGLSFLVLSCAVQACGGEDGEGGPSGGSAGVLTQAPHCPSGMSALTMEGTVDGATVNDQRPLNGQINAGFQNLSQLEFDTPFSNLAALPASGIEIHFTSTQSLFNGQTTTIASGTLVAPSGAAHAGQALCITAGQVGIVDGGSEDGALKFLVTGLRAGADCMGDVVPAELRGCFQ